MKDSEITKAKEFFKLAKEASANNADLFESEKSIPLEHLFSLLCKYDRDNPKRGAFRDIFQHEIREVLKTNADFEPESFLKSILAKISSAKVVDYEVTVSAIIKHNSSTTLPYSKWFASNSLRFYPVTTKKIHKVHTGDCYDSFKNECTKRMPYGVNADKLLDSYCYYKTKVAAISKSAAADIAINAFETYCVCATAAQQLTLRTNSIGATTIKSNAPIDFVGLAFVSTMNHSECTIYGSFDINTHNDEAITFTKDKNKVKKFKMFLSVLNEDSDLSKRIKSVLFEFHTALRTTNLELRYLSLWRAIEIATTSPKRKRSESEIIAILQRYYKDSALWNMKGKLILQLRNDLVHRGHTLEPGFLGSRDRQINWIKDYVQVALAILLTIRKKGVAQSQKEIDEFFDMYTQDISRLKMAATLYDDFK